MSGGGATPTTDIVPYQKDSHGLMLFGQDASGDDWLASDVNLEGDYRDNPSVMRFILERGITDAGGNPFDGVSAFEPGELLDDSANSVADLQTTVGALVPETDWDTYITKARTESGADLDVLDVDTLMEDIAASARRTVGYAVADALEAASIADRNDIVTKALSAFRARQTVEHFKSVSRFTAPVAQAGAINSSAYVVGIALLEGEFEDRLAQYDAAFTLPLTQAAFNAFVTAYVQQAQFHMDASNRAKLVEKQLKLQYLTDGSRLMAQLLRDRVTAEHSAAALKVDSNRIGLVALGEEASANLEIDNKASNWDLEIFQQAGNVLSAIHGSVVPSAGQTSRLQSAIGGGLGGAAIGAQIGSVVPGIGTAVGAGVGGLLGLIGGAS